MTGLDNVAFLDCPVNNMKLSLQELLEWVGQGRVVNLAVVAEVTEPEAPSGTAIYSGNVRDDNGSVFTMMGALMALASRIDRETIE